jgi:choice-of-anchor C domain-containing protein
MKINLIKNTMLAGAGVMLLFPAMASANLVQDGGFELPGISGDFTTYSTGMMGAWDVTSGSVDLIRNYWQPAEGSQSLDAAGNINGTIQQTIGGIIIGQTYLLTFDMAGNPDGAPTVKTLQASLGTQSQIFHFDTTGHTKDAMGWTLETATFVADGSILSFQDLSGVPSPYGSALDNVSLTAVPEASTVFAGAMMLLPLGVSAIRIMRKTRMA